MAFKKIILWICCTLLALSGLKAQSDYVVIDTIYFKGNKHTKSSTILRELNFGQGDTLLLADMSAKFEQNRLFLMNTNLFNKVGINIIEWKDDTHATLQIELIESWYIWPIPIFEIQDRNFNVWWYERKASLRRANYGSYLYYNNLTGHRDNLRLVVQFGYTQKYEIDYNYPFLDKAQTLGLGINVLYASNREVSYKTFEDKILFYKLDSINMLTRFRASTSLSYRPGIRSTHRISIEYQDNKTNDFTIDSLNRDYFLDGRVRQRYPVLQYDFNADYRDIRPYPLHGYNVNVLVRKDGFRSTHDRNNLLLIASYEQYFSFGKKVSLEWRNSFRLNLIRGKQAYYNNMSLGFGVSGVHGFEYYVVDGLDFCLFKFTPRYEILDKEINLGRFMPVKSFKLLPLKVYGTLNSDFAYVNNPYYAQGNTLSNQWLWGGGVGLDFVIYYNRVVQVEYSVNKLGERGFFLHFRGAL